MGVYPLVPLPGRQDFVRFASDNSPNGSIQKTALSRLKS